MGEAMRSSARWLRENAALVGALGLVAAIAIAVAYWVWWPRAAIDDSTARPR